MRTLVIGDIHGGLRALKQVLERAEATEEDLLIFLGDYVDGWSEAVETVNFLIGLKSSHQCVLLKGNHDELCHKWLRTGRDNPIWLRSGGEASVQSYLAAPDALKELHIQFYNQLDEYYLDNKNRLYLHAGFTNQHGVTHEYFSKTFYWDRTLWEMALCLNPQLPKNSPKYPPRLKQYAEVYIGHTPVTRIGKTTPQQAANVWNVDTGAAFKGCLSIIDADTKEYWQSDPVYTLYPEEQGRN
ncbi:MAG: metallophosphoesterase [Eudoraea sp.]|nr:metallophosphoesterase [Eudoraea sp.]MBT8211229.1 metallophosphoesterase [Eudoraea sp.]MBT8221555.1 metallophosphoesterase [Eudoraea sp.]MBT8322041.1 metallophosphoesterase [Eudoraea sp.]NNK30835.1 serine/threonine protein phosphatase [Flavobacteriaceae bacterium]